MIVFLSMVAVFIEIMLNWAGALVWHYWFWSARFPFLIILFGYGSFMFAAVRVHDMEKLRDKIITVGAIFVVDIVAIFIFGVILGWI